MNDAASPAESAVAQRDNDLEARVRAVVAEVLWLSAADIDVTTPLIDFGLDSPTAIDLTVQLEKVFDIAIPDDVAAELATVDQIVAYVREQLS
ncbi:acyl carrier protein [Nocardia altamirensis]|uniref:acyl carrier protein n=1 Tax=Nocardia altamirensis TaxID=472158 RepID=UPI0008406668|nr:acyl carrier protein [Nocardia altamirensis]